MSYRKYSVPYKPGQKDPYKLSRSKLELFMQCERCFWLDARLKIKRPSSPPFNINKAIDELFKKEFDIFRSKKIAHPLMKKEQIDAIPFQHKKLDKWRQGFGDDAGIDYLDKGINLHIFGAIDDVWINSNQELIIVDYKAAAKDKPVVSLGPEGSWHDMYRHQMEIYQWLFKMNNFKVSDTGYFVYATTNSSAEVFDNQLKFETNIFPHKGNTDWVDKLIPKIKDVLENNDMPPVGRSAMGGECEHCLYSRSRTELTLKFLNK